MTLFEIMECLNSADHLPQGYEAKDIDVVFDTSDRGDLQLFSVYYCSSDGKIHVDVGDDGDN